MPSARSLPLPLVALSSFWIASSALAQQAPAEAASPQGSTPTAGASPAQAAEAPATDADGDDGSARPADVELGAADERAKAHFDVGKSLYDSGRFNEAAEEWEKAYQLSGRPGLLYNVYIAHRDASDQPKAIDALKRYLATDDVEPKQRINLEARLRAMEEAQAATPPPAAEPAAPPPPPESVPAPAAATASASTDDPGHVMPYVLIGLGGSMAVAGVVTGLLANGKVGDIEDACPDDRCPAEFPLESRRDSAQTLVTLTDILLVGGLVAGGLGVVLLLVEEKDSRSGAATTAGCTPGGCFARVQF